MSRAPMPRRFSEDSTEIGPRANQPIAGLSVGEKATWPTVAERQSGEGTSRQRTDRIGVAGDLATNGDGHRRGCAGGH
jgi:hypothetical protein